MKVRIAVHGRFHAFNLAQELHGSGLLEAVHTTYPAFVAHRWLSEDIPIIGEPMLELRRRFAHRILRSHEGDAGIAIDFARAVAKRLPGSQADLLVGWSSAVLDAIEPAQAMGMKVVVERGSCHIDHQTRVLTEAYAAHGLSAPPTDPRIVERERAEYAAADAICVPSRTAAESFAAAGIDTNRLIVNPLGVDTTTFNAPAVRPRRDRPRVLFAGNAGIRKGVLSLLGATAALKGRIETVIAGPVEREIEGLMKAHGNTWTKFAGPLGPDAMRRAYRDADIFCLPSIEEGFGMAVVEAMACGLPVVVSDSVGAADAVTPGESGLIVPAGDADALAQALAELADDPDRRTEMGAAARLAVESEHSWKDTGRRAADAYRKLLG